MGALLKEFHGRDSEGTFLSAFHLTACCFDKSALVVLGKELAAPSHLTFLSLILLTFFQSMQQPKGTAYFLVIS